jgi:hypothetical protein
MAHAPKPVRRLPAADAAAEAVLAILKEHYDEKAPWLNQAAEVVKHSLESAIQQLSGASYTPVKDKNYRHAARTRDQLLADPSVQKEMDSWGV